MFQSAIYICISWYIDFLWKNADISRTQGVCHVIQKFFGSSLANFYNSTICVSSPEKAHPE